MYGVLDISTSGLVAQRTRLNAVAANLANKDAILDSNGVVNPYRERSVILSAGNPDSTSEAGEGWGVQVTAIVEDQGEPALKLDPGNPYAYKSGPKAGYVPVPNIDPVKQTVNAMEASRAYEANIAAAEATKQMMLTALRLLA